MRVEGLILKNLCESCSRRSARLGMAANIERYGHVVSVAVNDPESSSLYRFDLVNLCFREQAIPDRGCIFQYRSNYPCIEVEQLGLGYTCTPELF